MKTLTKILTVVALVVLCVALFTVTAFAATYPGHPVEEIPASTAADTPCTQQCTNHGYRCSEGFYVKTPTTGLDTSGATEYIFEDSTEPYGAISVLYNGTQGTKHVNKQYFTVTPATHTQTGYLINGYYCSDCNNYFDMSDNQVTQAAAVDPLKPYTKGKQIFTASPATCSQPGFYDGYLCGCGCGTYVNSANSPVSDPTYFVIPINESAHNWVPDPAKSKAPTDVSPGWTYYVCSNNPLHTKTETIDALGIFPSDGGQDIFYVVPINNTWQPGQEGLTFRSPLVEKLNSESGPNANYVGVRIGTSSLYENSYDTFDFWSWDQYVKLGEKTMGGLRPGKYRIWIYDKRYPDQYTCSCEFWVLDVPTLEPYNTDKHVVNSSKSLRFITDGEIVPGTVKVGSRTLNDPNDFFISNDRKSVTLSPDFLNARQTGTYTISALTKDGRTIKTNFYILSTAQASSSPRTGDESQIGLWAAFLLLSGAAIVVMVPKLRKHGVK